MSERYKFVDGHAHFISCAFVSSIKDAAYIWSNADPHLGFEFDEGKGAKGEKEARALTLAPVEGGYKEYYIRDAQGNVMAIYRYQLELVPNTNPQEYTASLMLTERPIYGSSRIGSHTQEMEMIGSTPPLYYPYTQPMPAPKKRYELTDHLGNVSTVVTGKLLPMAGGGYQADVVSAQSYEPFGSLLPGRNYSSGSYRFGFQGQEKDNEIYGATGTSYAFEYRMHDPRVGRFLSIDPLAAKYPYWSPYAFSGNRVIDKAEFEGLEPTTPPSSWVIHQDRGDFYGQGSTVMQVSDAGSVEKWWVTKAVNQNGTTSWNYYAPDLQKWGGNWIPEGYVEASSDGAPVAANGRAQVEARAQGRADAEAGNTTGLSKAILGVTVGGTGLLSGGALGYGTSKLLDAGNEMFQQYQINRGNFGLIDQIDVLGSAMPDVIGIPLQAGFDYTGSGGLKSVLSGDKPLWSAGVEVLFGTGESLMNRMYTKHGPTSGVPGLIGDQMTKFGTGAAAKVGERDVKGDGN